MPQKKALNVLSVILVSGICLLMALISLANAEQLRHWLSGYHGYHTQLTLKIPGVTKDTNRAQLILPIDRQCDKSCPSNLMLTREILNASNDTLQVVFMPLLPGHDLTSLMERFTTVTGQRPTLAPHTESQAMQQLAKFEQISTDNSGQAQHAGRIYLYYPLTSSLLSYSSPNAESIIEDLKKLTSGANDGDKYLKLVSN